MTDADLDAMIADLRSPDTELFDVADAIAALREQVATKDAELGRLRSGHETFLWKRAVENADREKKETVEAFMLLSNKHTLMTERAEKAEADNAALRLVLEAAARLMDGTYRGNDMTELRTAITKARAK